MELAEGLKLFNVQGPKPDGAVFAGRQEAFTLKSKLPNSVGVAGEAEQALALAVPQGDGAIASPGRNPAVIFAKTDRRHRLLMAQGEVQLTGGRPDFNRSVLAGRGNAVSGMAKGQGVDHILMTFNNPPGADGKGFRGIGLPRSQFRSRTPQAEGFVPPDRCQDDFVCRDIGGKGNVPDLIGMALQGVSMNALSGPNSNSFVVTGGSQPAAIWAKHHLAHGQGMPLQGSHPFTRRLPELDGGVDTGSRQETPIAGGRYPFNGRRVGLP